MLFAITPLCNTNEKGESKARLLCSRTGVRSNWDNAFSWRSFLNGGEGHYSRVHELPKLELNGSALKKDVIRDGAKCAGEGIDHFSAELGATQGKQYFLGRV